MSVATLAPPPGNSSVSPALSPSPPSTSPSPSPCPSQCASPTLLCQIEPSKNTDGSSSGSSGSTISLFVPGRICLFGEHSDWAGEYRSSGHTEILAGCALVSCTAEGLYAHARRIHKPIFRIISVIHEAAKEVRRDFECPLDDMSTLLRTAQSGGFFSYACGVAYQMLLVFNLSSLCSNGSLLGVEIDNYRTTLPVKKGLSSSAALTVLVARAFNSLFGLHLSLEGEMDFAYRGERMTPSKCGRLDQLCAFGDGLVSVKFDGHLLFSRRLTLQQAEEKIYLVIVDLKRSKDTKKILADLNAHYPIPTTVAGKGLHFLLGACNQHVLHLCEKCIESPQQVHHDDFQQLEQQIHTFIKNRAATHATTTADDNDGRCVSVDRSSCPSSALSPTANSHVGVAASCAAEINGNGIRNGADYLANCLPARLGRLMCLAQFAFDTFARPCSPDQLSSPMLHHVLAYKPIQSLIWGGKGVGSQGDGSAQFIARSAECQQKVVDILQTELAVECMKLTLG